MPPTKPQDFPLLLEVFREGIVCGLISKHDVVAWADGIIKSETEPDYFFIEMSVSHDTNGIAELLDKYISRPESVISFRVLMRLIYQKLFDGAFSVEKAVVLLEQMNYRQILTWIESSNIYSFEDYEILYPPNLLALKEDVLKFLSSYKDFNLTNYDQWPEINRQVEEVLNEEKAKADAVNDAFQKKWKRQHAKRKLIRSIPLGILFLIAIVVIVIDMITFETGTIHPMRIWYLNIFGVYFIARWGYAYWRKSR